MEGKKRDFDMVSSSRAMSSSFRFSIEQFLAAMATLPIALPGWGSVVIY
jgi:hypothetical protein